MGRIEDIKTVGKRPLKTKDTRVSYFTGDYIEEALTHKIRFVSSSKAGVIHASSIGDGPRLLVLRYKGLFQEQTEYQNIKYMEAGTASHELFQKRLQKAGLLIAAEISVPTHPDFDLRGRLDFVVRGPEGLDEPILIEYKTTGSKNFSRLSLPEPSHVSQWSTYAERKDFHYGLIIYESRDELVSKYFPVVRSGNDISLFGDDGHHKIDHPGYLSQLYDKVRFVVWCSNIGKFPKNKCLECVKWGCKQPKLCLEMETEKELVTIEDWKKLRKIWENKVKMR